MSAARTDLGEKNQNTHSLLRTCVVSFLVNSLCQLPLSTQQWATQVLWLHFYSRLRFFLNVFTNKDKMSV